MAIKEQNHLPSKTVLKAAFIPDASIPWFARPPAPLLPPSGSLQAHLPVPLLTAAGACQPPAGTRAGCTASLLKVPLGSPPTARAVVAQEGRLPPWARASRQLCIISRPSRQSAQRPSLVSYFSSHNGGFLNTRAWPEGKGLFSGRPRAPARHGLPQPRAPLSSG